MPAGPVSGKRILALGEPMVEFAAAGRGPLAEAESFLRGWGGDTSNFAVAAARVGGSSAYLGNLGDDDFGKSFLTLWEREGVDTARVRVVPGGYTAVYFISYREDGAHDFSYIRRGSAASLLAPDDLSPEQFAGVAAFHTSGITQAISNSACDAAFRAMDLARAAGALVSYDPNLRLKLWPLARAKAVVLESFRRAEIALPNHDEARLLTGLTAPEDLLQFVLDQGPRVAVVKLGAEGCLAGNREGERVRLPAFRVNAIDTGGAGDTFDAAFVVRYLEGASLAEAARFATAASALTTTGVGCVRPIPTRAAVEALLAQAA